MPKTSPVAEASDLSLRLGRIMPALVQAPQEDGSFRGEVGVEAERHNELGLQGFQACHRGCTGLR